MPKSSAFLIGGGATKQIPLNQLDRFFPELFPGADQRTVIALYRLVAWIYRCVRLRADAAIAVKWKLSRRGNEDSEVEIAQSPYGEVAWKLLWWKTLAARLIWGASYWLKLEDDLQWLNPATIRPVTDPVRGLIGFDQNVGGITRRYPVDQIVYLPTWNPTDDFQPGVAEGAVAQPPGALVANANEWTSKFFERGALPATVLTTERNIGDEEIERVESVWERLFGGVRNAFKTAVLRLGLKPTVIGFPLKDLALPELMQEEKEQVAAAFGIPITLLDAQAANLATAKQDDINFYTKTVFPDLDLIGDEVNRQLWWPLSLEWHWKFNEVEAIQQDEAEKAEGASMLMEEVDRQFAAKLLPRPRAVWLNDQLWDSLGYKFPDNIPDEEPDPGESLPEQMPPNMLQQRQRMNEITQGVEAAQRSVDKPAMLASLRRWRRKAKNRKGACEFESDNIPEWLGKTIQTRLAADWQSAFDPFLKIPDLQPGLERRLQRAITTIYDDWLGRITKATLAGRPIDLSGMYTEIQSVTELMYQEAITSGALSQAAALDWGVDYDNLITEGLEFSGRAGNLLTTRISGTDDKFIARVQAQLEAGEITEDATRDMLARAFGAVRAETIAITETAAGLSASSFALQNDLAAQGVKTVIRWFTAEDDKVCPICGPLDQTLDWQAAYPNGPPAHVKCRCQTVVEVVA